MAEQARTRCIMFRPPLTALHCPVHSFSPPTFKARGLLQDCKLSMYFQASEAREDARCCIPRDTKEAPRFCASQYVKNNSLQRKHNNVVLEFCQPAFFTKPHATMQILDIGCGTGDYTRDFLLPRCLPCDRLVGIDSSIQMIEYARRHSAHEKIEYELLDIGDDMTEFIGRRDHFDRVFSFYCLQWLRDQGAALKNVAALMRPGGECLLVFPASSQPGAVWRLLAEMDHWEKYSEFISKSHDIKDEKEQMQYMSSLLSEAGLCPSILLLPRLVTFDGCSEEDIIGAQMSLLPINHLVSNTERAQLLEDVTALVRKVHGPETDQSIFRTYIIMASKQRG
ncbi:juvenile hormone acid O-methyltransferase-like isoform X2 [Dermacentor albipictus]|uniref:juvenile hormone acid O-methyltransferase-like isoform X2 n=1 Tax=Dermacentor albipictus TaxID=60249 RepID=UPI0038FC5537